MSDFGPSQVSLGLFFDHSGQDLFEDGLPFDPQRHRR